MAEREARPDGTERAATDELDLVVVGGGSAGFAAAIRAADLGATVAIVENGMLGGTCVNVGCIPSKTLIRAAEVVHRASHHPFAGIRATLEPIDFGAVVRQKDDLVSELQHAKYWDVLAEYPTIQLVRGRARFRPDGTLEVDGEPLAARKVVIVTGSSPWVPPIRGLESVPFLTSREALSLEERPGSLIVIGAGPVGLELSQFYARMGTEVTIVKSRPDLLPHLDPEVGEELAKHLRAEGISIHDGVPIRRISGGPGAYRIEVGSLALESERLLVAVGRRANTKGMGLEEAGIRLGKKGEVLVDEHLESTRQGVYAAGDVTGDPMLVYVAARAGSLAAENALEGNRRRYDLSVVPAVIFTDPAVATVGLTEREARGHGRGLEVAVSSLPLSYVPRALAARDTRGFIKLVADATTNRLVGAEIVAPEAGEMIQEPAMAIRFGIPVDEIAEMLHPYLTHAEGIKLACQTFHKSVAKLSCCAA